jgi:hypothetical protein
LLENYRSIVSAGADGTAEVASMMGTVQGLSTAAGKGYYILEMERTATSQEPEATHCIGFGFRDSGAEFFDANLGLFYFPQRIQMANFFRDRVLESFRYDVKYRALTLFGYEKFLNPDFDDDDDEKHHVTAEPCT